MEETQPKILIVDDSVYHRRLIEKLIRREHPDFDFEGYDPISQGLPDRAFDWSTYDLLILDYQLRESTAFDWMRTYSHSPGFPPTIIVTGEGSEALAVQAIKMGAHDYLTKDDLNSHNMCIAVREAMNLPAESAIDATLTQDTISDTAQQTSAEFSANDEATQKNWNKLKDDATQSPTDEWPFTLDEILGGNAKIKYYKVTGYIGKGGMGTVFRARRDNYDETVALKLLHGKLSDDDTLVSRFIEEYSVIEEIEHPNIVKVYAQGFSDDHAYIIMEYLPAGHLKQAIRRGINRKDCLNYAYQIVSALGELHLHGIVHRDLKPLNVLFRETHVPVLVDFGVAKDLTGEDLNLTTQGRTVGTPIYSSPEQILGHNIDHRSDQYAFGVIFYEMLTGQKLFVGKTIVDIAMKHVELQPPALPEQYADLQPLIDKLLGKKAEDRFDTTQELLAELERYL